VNPPTLNEKAPAQSHHREFSNKAFSNFLYMSPIKTFLTDVAALIVTITSAYGISAIVSILTKLYLP